ncbi:MAG: hypothetical protein Q9213_002777 [Squamulea squamosa]
MAFFNAGPRTTAFRVPFDDIVYDVPLPSRNVAEPVHKSSIPAPPSKSPLDAAGLRERMAYVKTLQQRKGDRKVSGRTMRLLNTYKDNCEEATRASKGKQKDALLDRISIDDGILESVHEKLHGKSGLCQKVAESVAAMKEIRVSAELGDYASYSIMDLKGRTMDAEDIEWRKKYNSGVKRLIEECEWDLLANQLCHDRDRLKWLFENDPQAQKNMRAILQIVQDKIFYYCYESKGRVRKMVTQEAETRRKQKLETRKNKETERMAEQKKDEDEERRAQSMSTP